MGIETAAILSAVGSAVQVMGAMQAADDARKQAEYNQKVADMQARDAINRGNIEMEKQRVKTEQVMGAQRAAMGAAGIDSTSGSFANVLLDTATMGEKDAQTIRTNALREAWGYEQQSEEYGMEAEAVSTAASYNAFGSLLTGASNVGSKMGWFDAKVSPNASSGTGLKIK